MPNIHCLLGFLSQKIFSNCVYTFLHYGLSKDQPLLICCGLKQRVRYYDLVTCYAETTRSRSHSLRVYTSRTEICCQIMGTPLPYRHHSCFRLHNLYLTTCFCIDLLCLPKCLNFQVTEYDPLPVFAW